MNSSPTVEQTMALIGEKIHEALAQTAKPLNNEETRDKVKQCFADHLRSMTAKIQIVAPQAWTPDKFVVQKSRRRPSVELSGKADGSGERLSTLIKWRGSRRKTRVAAKHHMHMVFLNFMVQPMAPMSHVDLMFEVDNMLEDYSNGLQGAADKD